MPRSKPTTDKPVSPDTTVVAPAQDAPSGAKPYDPGFIPEGTRQELEHTGEAVNPFTGARITG